MTGNDDGQQSQLVADDGLEDDGLADDGFADDGFSEVLSDGQPRERVDKVLAQRLVGVTRETIKRWIAEGRVTIDERACKPRDKVGAGNVIRVRPGPEPRSAAEPDPSVPVNVLFEDEHLVVVMKPAGLVVHPGRGNWTKTLVNGLLARPEFQAVDRDPRDPEGHLRPGIVHRLDKDTSGILVVAKSASAREGLKQQLQNHSMVRCYRALTIGVPREGAIRTLHGRDPRSRLRFSSFVTQGKEAVTYVVIARRYAGDRAAQVECRLETGRTHQIRVHLSQQTKTPILADALYGGASGSDDLQKVARQLGRQALHAAELGFIHPITGKQHHFEEPLPSDMSAAAQALAELGGS